MEGRGEGGKQTGGEERVDGTPVGPKRSLGRAHEAYPRTGRFVQNREASDPEPKWHGLYYTALLFGVAVVQSVSLHQYFHRVMSTGMRLRTAIVTAVYHKALRLSNSARQTATSGEIVNLMAVDAQRFMDLMSYINMVWSAPYQMALALYFLGQLLGIATVAGAAVFFFFLVFFLAGSCLSDWLARGMGWRDALRGPERAAWQSGLASCSCLFS